MIFFLFTFHILMHTAHILHENVHGEWLCSSIRRNSKVQLIGKMFWRHWCRKQLYGFRIMEMCWFRLQWVVLLVNICHVILYDKHSFEPKLIMFGMVGHTWNIQMFGYKLSGSQVVHFKNVSKKKLLNSLTLSWRWNGASEHRPFKLKSRLIVFLPGQLIQLKWLPSTSGFSLRTISVHSIRIKRAGMDCTKVRMNSLVWQCLKVLHQENVTFLFRFNSIDARQHTHTHTPRWDIHSVHYQVCLVD